MADLTKEILEELIIIITNSIDDIDLISTINSYGDSLSDEMVLNMLRAWNVSKQNV
jgi:hypothetical protein